MMKKMMKKSRYILAIAAFLVLGILLLPGKAQAAPIEHGGLTKDGATTLSVYSKNGTDTRQIDFDKNDQYGDTRYFRIKVGPDPAWIYLDAKINSAGLSSEYEVDIQREHMSTDSDWVTLSNRKTSGILPALRYEEGTEVIFVVKAIRGYGSFDLTVHYYKDPYDSYKDVKAQHTLTLNKKLDGQVFPQLSLHRNSDYNKTWYKFTTGKNQTYLFTVDYKPTTERSSYIYCDLYKNDKKKLDAGEYSLDIYDGSSIEDHIITRVTNIVTRSTAQVYKRYVHLEPNTTYYLRVMGSACSYSLAVGGFSLSSAVNYAQPNEGSYSYDGSAKKPGGWINVVNTKPKDAATIVDSDFAAFKLVEGVDYTIAYKDNVNAGTAKLIFNGKGLITGQYTDTFRIEKAYQELSISPQKYTKTNVSSLTLKPKSTNTSVWKGAGSKTFTYKSSNKKIATVAKTGKVTFKKTGTVTITISAPATKNFYKAPSSVKAKITIQKAPKGTKFTCGGLKYQITQKDKKVAVIGSSSKSVKKVKIPDKIKVGGVTYTVTAIGANAFKNCKKLSSVTIAGKNIKSIGKNAFQSIKKNAAFTVPKAKMSAYKKLLTAKTGYKRTMKIKGK